MAGALTSTPTLVGAQNAVMSGLALVPEGMTREDLVESVSVGYAITYIFGTVGLLLLVKLLPSLPKSLFAKETLSLVKALEPKTL